MNLWNMINFSKDASNSFDLRPNLLQWQHLSTATHTATCAATHAATHAATRCNTYCNMDWCGSYTCEVCMATGRKHCNTLRNITICIAAHCNARYYRIYPCDFWSVTERERWNIRCNTLQHTLQLTLIQDIPVRLVECGLYHSGAPWGYSHLRHPRNCTGISVQKESGWEREREWERESEKG